MIVGPDGWSFFLFLFLFFRFTICVHNGFKLIKNVVKTFLKYDVSTSFNIVRDEKKERDTHPAEGRVNRLNWDPEGTWVLKIQLRENFERKEEFLNRTYN